MRASSASDTSISRSAPHESGCTTGQPSREGPRSTRQPIRVTDGTAKSDSREFVQYVPLPSPRMNQRWATGIVNFLSQAPMYTSTTLLSASESKSYTCSQMSVRLTTWPVRTARYSKTAYLSRSQFDHLATPHHNTGRRINRQITDLNHRVGNGIPAANHGATRASNSSKANGLTR